MSYILAWVLLSFAVAYYGKDRHAGFGFTLVFSLLLSPVIGFILAAAMGPKRTIGAKCPHCGWVGPAADVVAGFCPACGKNKEGLTRSDYQARAESVTLSSGR